LTVIAHSENKSQESQQEAQDAAQEILNPRKLSFTAFDLPDMLLDKRFGTNIGVLLRYPSFQKITSRDCFLAS